MDTNNFLSRCSLKLAYICLKSTSSELFCFSPLRLKPPERTFFFFTKTLDGFCSLAFHKSSLRGLFYCLITDWAPPSHSGIRVETNIISLYVFLPVVLYSLGKFSLHCLALRSSWITCPLKSAIEFCFCTDLVVDSVPEMVGFILLRSNVIFDFKKIRVTIQDNSRSQPSSVNLELFT